MNKFQHSAHPPSSIIHCHGSLYYYYIISRYSLHTGVTLCILCNDPHIKLHITYSGMRIYLCYILMRSQSNTIAQPQ